MLARDQGSRRTLADDASLPPWGASDNVSGFFDAVPVYAVSQPLVLRSSRSLLEFVGMPVSPVRHQ